MSRSSVTALERRENSGSRASWKPAPGAATEAASHDEGPGLTYAACHDEGPGLAHAACHDERPDLAYAASRYLRAHARHIVRYVLVGAMLAVLNLAFLYGVRSWLHPSDAVAVTAMYVFGVIIHFPSHRWITYRAQDRPARPQVLRYILMLIWNFTLMQAIVALAAHLSISPYLAVIAATGLTVVSNFLVMAHVVFVKRRRS